MHSVAIAATAAAIAATCYSAKKTKATHKSGRGPSDHFDIVSNEE